MRVPRGADAPARSVAQAAIDRALDVLAFALIASMFAGAVHDVSQSWDVWYYHLPFAARLGGVVSGDGFTLTAANEARFAGYPRLGELLQGILWRVTGRAECANLVAFASVPLLAWLLKRRFDVPPRLSILGLLAVPLVHVHATSCYVDLPGNAAAAALVILAIQAWAEAPAPVSGRTLALAGLAAGIAVNTRFQLHPVVLAASIAVGARVLPPLVRELRGPSPARARRTAAMIVVALPIVFAAPLENLIVRGNPYYPVQLQVLGHTLPGTETTYDASPTWLERAPRPARFVASLLEIGVRPMTSRRRWTIDQWMPAGEDGSRLGGFFNAYVCALLALLAWRVARDRSRASRVAGAGFVALTALTSVLPQSHELRYYLYWMIVLVALNLWLACKRHPEGERAGGPGPRVVGVTAAAALAAVLAVTRCGYAYPSGSTFAEVVAEHAPAAAVAGIADGERVCVRRAPWNLAWASAFHAKRSYSVKEAEDPGECGGRREIP